MANVKFTPMAHEFEPKTIDEASMKVLLVDRESRIAELEAALRGLMAVCDRKRNADYDECLLCEKLDHAQDCPYILAEQAAQKALGGE